MKPEVKRRHAAAPLSFLETTTTTTAAQSQVQERLIDLEEEETSGRASGRETQEWPQSARAADEAAEHHHENLHGPHCGHKQQRTARLVTAAGARSPPSLPQPLERLFTVILLPFIFVFLLPTPNQPPIEHQGAQQIRQQTVDSEHPMAASRHASDLYLHEAAGELLRAFVRLPLDRLRLQSGGSLVMLAEGAKMEISSKSDLQEEENEQTHMLLLQAPAEHRASYAPAGYHQNQHHQVPPSYGERASAAAAPIESESPLPQGESHAQGGPATGDYGAASGGPDEGGRPLALVAGQGEASVLSESAGGQQAAGGGSALQTRSDLPSVRALNVKCEKNHMTVNIVFDRPFYGMVFSKGHYNDQKCVHLPPNSGQTSVNFDIHLGKCGMSSSDAGGGSGLLAAATSTSVQQQGGRDAQQQQQQQQQPNGVFIENTIIIQYDPLVQEIYDQARKLRCTWYDYYEKSVTFRPYNVDMLDAVTANFLGDNIQCWMQIQVGKGPWSSEVAGIVKIGQTMTMVLAIKDDENRFDMLVRNCVAHDGKHQPIQLVDEYGCVARPKIMGKFQKVRNFGPAATVVSYAHFQAFKFPDSMSVHFQCVIQVCRYECPEPVCTTGGAGAGAIGGGSGGELGGPGASASSQDYATSGTEMVASGETLPPPPPQVATTATTLSAESPTSFFNPLSNATAGHTRAGPSNNLNLRLDESQGRVQVKLDTSMMAALGGNNGRPAMVMAASAAHHQQQQQQHAGPLPPHLLHATSASEHQGRAGHLAGAPPYYRPAAASLMPQGGAQALPSGSVRHLAQQQVTPHAQHAPPVGPHSNAQVLSFSPQFPASAATVSRRLAAYTSRLGDQAPSGATAPGPHESVDTLQVAGALAPYEAEYPLSLIASPRGLRLGPALASDAPGDALNTLLHNRVRRQAASESPARDRLSSTKESSGRQSRHLRPDSTSVQTHKTIQVVSPDDVAFSLLDPSDGHLSGDQDDDASSVSQSARRRGPSKQSLAQASVNSVCISTGRFLWGAFVTLGALLASIVIVAYVILKQRSQLEHKLSAVYVEPPRHNTQQQQQQQNFAPSSGSASCGSTRPMVTSGHSSFRQAAASYINDDADDLCRAVLAAQQQQAAGASSHKRRQQDEIQQRNNYLSRLYSQFAPATYWR